METQCLECMDVLHLAEDARIAEIVTCPECQAHLEIISIQPLKLALAPEIEEDWGE